MSRPFSYKIIPWFSAACLSLLLPFVVGGNAWAQNYCTPADVKGQIKKLRDDKGRKAASDVLVNCGLSAMFRRNRYAIADRTFNTSPK